MVLRNLRWLSASVLAAVAMLSAPARSEAGTQILIEEVDNLGNPVPGSAQYFSGTSATFATTNFLNITVTATANSGAVSSLTTTVSAVPATTFDATHSLEVIVTNDSFTTPNVGGTALVQNNAAASSGIGGGQNILTNATQLFNLPLSPDTTSTSALATGTALGSATGVATDTRPGGGASQTTMSNISNLPSAFAIQQTIFVRANPTDPAGISTGSTLGGSASSIVITSPAPVPAPAGLALALAAVPVLGLRRALRRKTEAVNG
ncbi:MAG: hypothetical protein JWO38_2958 [Gemmataceae bacterium]|nr:hypothetical protein [Gemmataceae bacterium]